ncbi:gamma-aminobutyric acid receptor-associated protein-like 1 isoform X3 [Erythrolamprus reginae]|uniref:gamma-aminobutyric acid receptor-associated protein-like 1 isoform X3 n=1 Tax=Erythrolamprus reginae TaxID=121349 RepID=UPI00396CB011
MMGKCTQVVTISILACLAQIPQVKLQENCTNNDLCSNTNWVHHWYIWLVVSIGGLLILCALVSVCVRCCCFNCLPGEDAHPQPYEVTVIAFDHDSTLQSTITSDLEASESSQSCSSRQLRFLIAIYKSVGTID